ncbi:hypothetical protein [Actinomycetospora chiangmaiensis]|uniref:hypothetical protein n=1 Tax=Actinomycetospora chiangmaiensis TaxID=402650 RepID=UPI00035F0E5F|nr:hypothetical protein [Actinomycetospora chiangmaiensis]
MPRPAALAAAALPPLLLAGVGLTHPLVLTPETAPWWRDLHVIGLVAFPLLALGPWVVVRGRGWLLEGTVVVLGLVYACFYTALDVLAGIGGGHETVVLGPGPWVSALFGIADRLVVPGVYAYLAAAVVGGITAVIVTPGPRRAVAVVGTVLVVGGAYSFLTSHIYYPVGVLTTVVLAVGWTALAAVVPPVARSVRSTPRRRQPVPT